jgi:hypothetical protein
MYIIRMNACTNVYKIYMYKIVTNSNWPSSINVQRINTVGLLEYFREETNKSYGRLISMACRVPFCNNPQILMFFFNRMR